MYSPVCLCPCIFRGQRYGFPAYIQCLFIQNPTPARLADEKSLRVIRECHTFATSSWEASGLWLRCSLLSWSSLMDDELPETAPLRSLLGRRISKLFCISSYPKWVRNSSNARRAFAQILYKMESMWIASFLNLFVCPYCRQNNIFRLNEKC